MSSAEDEANSGSSRQALASLGGVAVAVIGLLVWYKLKLSIISSWWGSVHLFFMPALVGVCIGSAMRCMRREGTFGIAGFAVILTAVVGFIGIGMQHWLNVSKRIQILADATYDETLEYAKLSTAASDDKKLREVLANNQTAVVGRLVARDFNGTRKGFWLGRNYIHFHWLVARQILINGQGGADRTIWEATKVMENGPFLDDVIRSLIKEPIVDEDVSNFRRLELPSLRQLAVGDITRDDFEFPLIATVRGKINKAALAGRGFDPFTGGFLLFGCVMAYKLVRQPSDNELL